MNKIQGFISKQPHEKRAKKEREARIKDQLANPKNNPTNNDVYDLMLDIAERQNELLKLMKTNIIKKWS